MLIQKKCRMEDQNLLDTRNKIYKNTIVILSRKAFILHLLEFEQIPLHLIQYY